MKKESIQKRIDDAKAEIEEAKSKGNLRPEALSIINTLLIIVEIMVAIFLEKKIRKNSSNSGLPPSSDFGSNGNRNKKSDKEDNKKRGERLGNTRIQKNKEVLSPQKCSKCHADLKRAAVIDTEERKTIDILYEIQETTLISETRQCLHCRTKTKAGFPEGVNGKIQYGNGIKAAIINFLMVQMMSLQRVQEHFKGLTGRMISQAVMLKYIAQLDQSLKQWEEDRIKDLLKFPVIHVDETSMRVNKKNYWIHTYGFEDIVLQFIHEKRGLEAINDIGIISKYGGIIVHDCLASYFSFTDVKHALCIAHLLRELKFVEESTIDKWATKLKRLLRRVVKIVTDREDKILTEKEYGKLVKIYRLILTQALEELPPFPTKLSGKRGRPKHTDAQNLWIRLKKHEDSILMFAKVAEVDPTNNRAERDLRMSKVKKKVSGCFRNPKFAGYFCRISSYVKTMRYKRYSSLEAISMALKGEIPV